MIGLAYSLQNSVLKINWATFQPRIFLILAKFDNNNNNNNDRLTAFDPGQPG